MYSKIKISGVIEVVTGMHIGGSTAFSAIGACDSPVVKDPLSGLPLLPGSSLKGKLRTLLARSENEKPADSPENDAPQILNLFGSTKGKNRNARLQFSDAVMSNWETLEKRGLRSSTEVKFENTIKRISCEANPRQIERAVRGSEFPLELIYERSTQNDEEVFCDLELISKGFTLLQFDYLGGSGSRGYGKVAFKNIKAELAVGDKLDDIFLAKCNDIFKDFQ
ncbi:type III-A CRISPR-associated RAMP protein Csm3 [Succinivibrio sp.]|uniref:type III-A CRISPR-associated RAMP protein Csm3 n=1 Tax=Succinivibrio sp. TaxID=2053619 RepID=UPI0025DB1B9C|nr:type III-A CRISPR-associated RAMP protein Csm3 [Succinivibrio sp.]MBQ9222079.1 type III-A CRISPR-associated RAMP protein Csm3 [Succinivibrio sp.]